MLFKSQHKDLDIPTQIPTWDWLFSPSSASSHFPVPPSPASFINTTTKDQITHPEIKHCSTYLSTALKSTHGLKEGDVISICAPNSIWYPVALFGVMRAGGVPALSSPGYTVDEMMHAFRTVGCKFVVTSLSALEVVRSTARKVGIKDKCIFILDGEVEGFGSIRSMIEEGRKMGEASQVMSYKLPQGRKNSEVCAVLCFSSGTTGLPKAVMISHQNIVAQCLQLLPTTSPDHKTVLGLLPFYHITGVVKMLILPFTIHATVVLPPPFTIPTLLSVISHYRIAEIQVVPPIIIRLVHDPIVPTYDLSCVKRFASGAAPISEEVLALLEKRFPGRGFKQGYGMTESCGCITTHPLEKHSFKNARTGGTLVANTEVKVVNEKGDMVGVDEKGEILAKGPQIFMGYFKNPKASAEAFDHEGFLRTGDEGSISAEGLITIHDRIKEMIKVKGVQVAPAELEDLLLGHPKVEDCAVIGVADDYSGEKPLAFVVLKAGRKQMEGLEDEILTYVKERKARPKWLKGVRVVTQIPKSPSGKILRRVLRDRIKEEARSQKPKL